jgi:hypothetical protein
VDKTEEAEVRMVMEGLPVARAETVARGVARGVARAVVARVAVGAGAAMVEGAAGEKEVVEWVAEVGTEEAVWAVERAVGVRGMVAAAMAAIARMR